MVDRKKFRLDYELFLKKVNILEFMYKMRGDSSFLSIMILDDYEFRKCISSKLSELIPSLCCFDDNDLLFDLVDFNRCLKENDCLVICLDNYFREVSFFKNISLNEAKDLFYQSINMCRDSLFLKNKRSFFIFFSDIDYNHFMDIAGDFCEYCQCRLNFNECFIDSNNKSLDQYYKDKHRLKILKKGN